MKKKLPILFRYDDICDLYPNILSYYSFLDREIKKGTIKQIKKGLYGLLNPLTDNFYANKLQIASNLFPFSYISYHEALEYYGLATQCFVSKVTYLNKIRVDPIEIENIDYICRKSVCNLQIVEENNTRVVSLERALIDSINCPNLSCSFEEIEQALDHVSYLDEEKLLDILTFYDKYFLYQKVGYLFEKHFGNKLSKHFYEVCLENTGNVTRYLEKYLQEVEMINKWHLIVPKEREVPNELY